MLFWIASLLLVKFWIVPSLAYTTGFRKSLLHIEGKLCSLLTDVTEGVVGKVVLHCFLDKFQPLASNSIIFKSQEKWVIDVGLGCLMFSPSN